MSLAGTKGKMPYVLKLGTKEAGTMDRRVTQTRFVKAEIPKLKRVAVYARVSSGKDAMLHSLSA